MTPWITLAGLAVTVAAAVRSTWSPCGLSMLASITPLSELGRGHRYRATATWFVLGSVVGGLTLGAAAAGLAAGFSALVLTARVGITVALVAGVLAVVSDIGPRGFHLPVHHRQVNERWLDRFRPWVYGAGFGWQIGTGVATYVMTAAVYLVVVLAALTGRPWVALGFGALFGLVRGLSVLLGRRITSPQTLASFHQRFYEWGPRVRRATIAVELAATGLFAWLLSPWAPLVVGLASLGGLTVWAGRRRARAGTAAAESPGQPAVSGTQSTPAELV
jgi:hypothetical protein